MPEWKVNTDSALFFYDSVEAPRGGGAAVGTLRPSVLSACVGPAGSSSPPVVHSAQRKTDVLYHDPRSPSVTGILHLRFVCRI